MYVVGTQKPSRLDGSFSEHPKHMFKLMDKNISNLRLLFNLEAWLLC